MDRLDKIARYTRCREVKKGETDRILAVFHREAQKARGYTNINSAIRKTRKALKSITLDKTVEPLKVSVVGEIYIAAHPPVNLELEKKLGNMGVEVHNHLSVSHWISEHFVKKLLPFEIRDKALKAGMEFIHTDDIGGHGIHTIGNTIISAKKGFDGVIQIYPFTCMPEIIAQSAFSEVQKKYDIPVMTLIVDEMTGEAGYITRLEAFVDMLKMKRAAAEKLEVGMPVTGDGINVEAGS